jgi:hypothetical protein
LRSLSGEGPTEDWPIPTNYAAEAARFPGESEKKMSGGGTKITRCFGATVANKEGCPHLSEETK